MAGNLGTTTLLRSLFQRTSPLLITQVVITLLFCLFIKDIDLSLGNRGMMDRTDVRTLVTEGGESLLITVLLITVNALFAIGSVLLQHSDSKQLRMSLPVRVYLLPMTFRRLAALHMIYGMAAVGTVTGIAAFLTTRNLGAMFPIWLPTALGVALYAVGQAWAFVFGGSRRPVAAVIGMLVCGSAIVLAMRSEMIVGAVTDLSALAGTAGVLVLGAVLFEISVRMGRENRFRAFEGASISSGAGKKLEPFKSPYWTQVWYEWRTNGWVLPCLVVVILTVYFVGVPLFTAVFFSSFSTADPDGGGFAQRFATHWGDENQHTVSTGMLSTALGAGVLTGAYLFLMSGEWRSKSTFLRTRPMTTDRMAWVRLTVLFFSTFCAAVILMSAFTLINLTALLNDNTYDYLDYLRRGYDHIPDFLVTIFFAGSIFVIMWTGLWIVNVSLGLGVYGVLMVLSMLVTFALIQTTDLAGDGKIFYGIEQAPVWFATALWIGGSVWVFLRARRDHVIPRGALICAAVFWLAYIGPFLYYGLGIRYYADYSTISDEGVIELHWAMQVTDLSLVSDSSFPFTHPVNWVLWAGLSLFPILPFVSLPYRLNAMRHD